jgi:hypothetical protein
MSTLEDKKIFKPRAIAYAIMHGMNQASQINHRTYTSIAYELQHSRAHGPEIGKLDVS